MGTTQFFDTGWRLSTEGRAGRAVEFLPSCLVVSTHTHTKCDRQTHTDKESHVSATEISVPLTCNCFARIFTYPLICLLFHAADLPNLTKTADLVLAVEFQLSHTSRFPFLCVSVDDVGRGKFGRASHSQHTSRKSSLF